MNCVCLFYVTKNLKDFTKTLTTVNYINRTGGLTKKKGLNRKGQVVTASTSAEIKMVNINAITSASANAIATIVSDGGATITARGFCWSTTTNPTIENSITSEIGPPQFRPATDKYCPILIPFQIVLGGKEEVLFSI